MIDENKLLSSLEKIQRDIDSLKQEIASQRENNNDKNFKTIVNKVENMRSKNQDPGSARLEGNIETI